MSTRVRCLLCLVIIIALATSAFCEDFTIQRFHADIAIHGDSSFTVTETIEVLFHRQRHGIYREIPYRYRDESRGTEVTTPLEIVSVTDAGGKAWQYKISREGRVMNVRIGDPERYVEGHQTYRITYTVENALLFLDDHDELYWNVTGNYWWSPIREASVRVVLPKAGAEGRLRGTCYTGALGSRESACRFETSGAAGLFSTTRPLREREGLTIAFGWDKGFVSTPGRIREAFLKADVMHNWVFILPFLSFVAMFVLWQRGGRDPKTGESLVVMYAPPEHSGSPVSPAEAGVLTDQTLHPRDVSATIIDLAAREYIKIDERKTEGLIFDRTDYYLAKVKEPGEPLSSFETTLMESLFQGDAQGVLVSGMKNKFYKNLDRLKGAIDEDLVRLGYYRKGPEKVRQFFTRAALIAGIAVAVLPSGLSRLPFAHGDTYSGQPAIAGVLTGLIVYAFGRIMPAKTRSGASARAHVLGFEEFLSRAERDRIERMADRDLFMRFLPYAIALDVVENWTRAFEGIYQETPRWYVSSGNVRAFSARDFSAAMHSVTSSLATAMFSAPRGSGLGGGGSSGGGSGGGGGGSW